MTRIVGMARRLLRDQAGQFGFIFIVGTIPLFLTIFLIVNYGKASFDATRTQDAADMLALTHATEAARSMNTLAMNHVSLTQTYVTAVNASSLENTINIHHALMTAAIGEAGLQGHKICKKWPKLFPKIGYALYGICMVPTLEYIAILVQEQFFTRTIDKTYEPEKALELAAIAIDTLDTQNEKIVDRFPETIRQQATLIATEHKTSDFYFDDTCKDGVAKSCNTAVRRQGMDLPVTSHELKSSVSLPEPAHLTFCSALFFGTGGFSGKGGAVMSTIGSKLGGFRSIALINGSFEKRGFPINHGPMYGGEDDGYLPRHISLTSGMGDRLTYYNEVSVQKRIYDGVINAFQSFHMALRVGANMAVRAAFGRSTRKQQNDMRNRLNKVMDNPLGFLIIGGYSTKSSTMVPLASPYPFEQTPEVNVFTRMVEARTGMQCLGTSAATDLFDAIGGEWLHDLGFTTQVPAFTLYHPVMKEDSILPVKLRPQVEDFHDAFKPLTFSIRQPGIRWAKRVFGSAAPGYVKYSQGFTFNSQEISLYSQAWRARLIPATKFHEFDDVAGRMKKDASPTFDAFRDQLEALDTTDGWADAVSK